MPDAWRSIVADPDGAWRFDATLATLTRRIEPRTESCAAYYATSSLPTGSVSSDSLGVSPTNQIGIGRKDRKRAYLGGFRAGRVTTRAAGLRPAGAPPGQHAQSAKAHQRHRRRLGNR